MEQGTPSKHRPVSSGPKLKASEAEVALTKEALAGEAKRQRELGRAVNDRGSIDHRDHGS